MNKNMFAIMTLAIASTAFAQHSPEEQLISGKEKKVDQLVSDLGLTDDQKTKIQSSRDKFRPQIAEKETAYNMAKDRFSTAIQNSNATGSDLEGLYKQQEDAHRSLMDTQFKSRMEFRDILTPEQRKKMITKRDEVKDKIRAKVSGKDKKVDHIPPANVIQPVPPPAPVINK